jgi:hypothetical protein
MTSRERRIAWLKANDDTALSDVKLSINEMFRLHGFDWLADDQIDQLIEFRVERERQRAHASMRSRNFHRNRSAA